MNSLKRSNCGLVNFANSTNCQRCQTPLAAQTETTEFASNRYRPQFQSKVVAEAQGSILENSGFRRILFGIAFIIGGVAMSYVNLGGRHYVFYGAVLFGVINIVKGIIGLFTNFD